jgi:hypothetical protein
MKKFERVRALLSNRKAKPSFEAVLEAALDEFLKDHDPEGRKKRRDNRKEKAREEAEPTANPTERDVKTGSLLQPAGSAGEPPRDSRAPCDAPLETRISAQPFRKRDDSRVIPSRHIPAATRDAVFARDKGRCTYVGSSGKRCEATHHLQVDHIVPVARGGRGTVDNLRLLCERHNKHEAERVLGAGAVRRFHRRSQEARP